ncbi:phosphoglycolate phosphatase [Salinispirillum marinum]|uniref:phosphoglycolate phosphatase n=2 Tax=Saccharospirillaceae TaxID=255527 RepID=A0ABV8B9B8_9GAMM
MKAVLFDLDGTLVDSLPTIARGMQDALAILGLPSVTEEQVGHWIGEGTPVLARKAATAVGAQEHSDALFSQFFPSYLPHIPETPEIAGATELLQRLHMAGLHCALVTNKPRALTEPLLAALDWDRYLPVVICGDDLAERKPHPLPLQEACRRLNVDVADAVMVGDSRHDIAAARAAGMPVAALAGGYNHGEIIQGADFHGDTLQECGDWVLRNAKQFSKVSG